MMNVSPLPAAAFEVIGWLAEAGAKGYDYDVLLKRRIARLVNESIDRPFGDREAAEEFARHYGPMSLTWDLTALAAAGLITQRDGAYTVQAVSS